MSTDPTTPDTAADAQDPSNTPIEQLVTDLDPDDDVLAAVREQQAALGITDAPA